MVTRSREEEERKGSGYGDKNLSGNQELPLKNRQQPVLAASPSDMSVSAVSVILRPLEGVSEKARLSGVQLTPIAFLHRQNPPPQTHTQTGFLSDPICNFSE